MVLFTVRLGIIGTIQEQNKMGLDSIYQHFFGNDMEMYKMYDRICQASEGIAEPLVQMPKLRS